MFYGNRYTHQQGEDKTDRNRDNSESEQEPVEQQADVSDVNKPAHDTTASAAKL